MVEEEYQSVHQLEKMEKLLVFALCLTLSFALPLHDGKRVKRGFELASSEEEEDSHSGFDFSSIHHGFSLGGAGGLSFGSHHQEPEFHESVQVEPVHKTLKVPIPHPVKQPIQIPYPVRVLEPYHIKIPVPVQVEKIVQVPVEKIVEYPVEKLVPVKVVKKVRVPVPKPYPVPVPVYKTKYVYHTKKYHHED